MPTAVITGSNRGIGLALVQVLVKDGYTVFAACRQSNAELGAIQGVTVVEGVDCTKQEGIDKLKSAIGSTEIELLINNAGKGDADTGLEQAGLADMMREMFEINAVAPMLVTLALKKNLKSGAHVAVISSSAGSIATMAPIPGGLIAYPTSKAAVNMATSRMAAELKPAGVSAAVWHPGVVATEMLAGFTGGPKQAKDKTAFGEVISTEESATGLLACFKAHQLEDGCTFKDYAGAPVPW